MTINADADRTIKMLGLFMLWIVLMTLAGWYGRGQEPVQYYNLSSPPSKDAPADTGR